MSDVSVWRRAYDAVERNVSPRVEAVVHSDEFATVTAVIASTGKWPAVRSTRPPRGCGIC